MAHCSNCGTQGSGKFCPNCGTPMPQAAHPFQQPQPMPYSQPYVPAPPPRRARWPWVAGGVAVGLVAVLGIAAALGDEPAPSRPSVVSSNEGTGKAQPSTPPPAKQSGAGAYYVGRWRCWSFGGGACPVGWEQLLIKDDGTYTLAGNPGKWRTDGTKIIFTGPLEFAGPAAPYEKDQFKFDYVDKSGFGTYILFVKW